MLISQATKNNWKKLNVSERDIQKKLTRRANKRYSKKTFIPLEYSTTLSIKDLICQICENTEDIQECIYYLAVNLLNTNGIFRETNEYLVEILSSFKPKNAKKSEYYLSLNLPVDEKDFLGLVYQSLISEGKKNRSGSYYTPQKLLEDVLPSVLNKNAKFLDPCCGTGSFLLAISDSLESPENIYGFDLDEVACFIAKINLIIKFKDKKFRPNIFNKDFLLDESLIEFDLIATNPPWGALPNNEYKKLLPEIKSDESFSYFIVKSFRHLAKNGQMIFILPESILNVKAHKDVRKFILDNFQIESIKLFGKAFSNVLSNVVGITLNKSDVRTNIKVGASFIHQKFYENNVNYIFSILDNYDAKILDKIYSQPYYTLKDSVWALGIVTGNNAELISNKEVGEKIYSGKDISKLGIADSQKFIIYDRNKFQQTAPDEIYRAKEKLVYKFISKKLIFAYDDKQRLFLNSANILIPEIKGYSVRNVMKFLNSTLFQYIYSKLFSELKVLKGNLMTLPFPKIDLQEDFTDEDIFKFYKLNDNEIEYIKSQV